ncbi:Zeaxanthin epoxidase [Spatholobus suberectus]|nr:Zeaxanthin epoxidase [Spatholobus suberectus]
MGQAIEQAIVRVILENGEHHDSDILVGADGIWLEVRLKLFGWQEAKYSGFTCYNGLTSYVPPYIDTIGVLGLELVLCSLDVGHGKMQWYAFHGEPPSSDPFPKGKKKRLLDLFGNWCNEDCYQLILELDKVAKHGSDGSNVISALRRYEKKRIPRVRVLHIASRMASKMLVNYRPFIEFKFWTLSNVTNVQIKHPDIHVARALFKFTFTQFVTWMIAGHGYLSLLFSFTNLEDFLLNLFALLDWLSKLEKTKLVNIRDIIAGRKS